jgi:hypothetical protein
MSDEYITHKDLNAAILEAKNHAKDNMRHQMGNLKEDLEAVGKSVIACHKRIDILMVLSMAGLLGFVIALFVVALL